MLIFIKMVRWLSVTNATAVQKFEAYCLDQPLLLLKGIQLVHLMGTELIVTMAGVKSEREKFSYTAVHVHACTAARCYFFH